MSIYRNHGLVKKSGGLFNAIIAQLKSVNLKPVTKINYKFDPFHHNASEIRSVIAFLSDTKVRRTNLNCSFKTEVVCDLSEPEIVCTLINGSGLRFKAGNLTTFEILQQFNKYVLPLVPPEEETPAPVVQTKSQKKK